MTDEVRSQSEPETGDYERVEPIDSLSPEPWTTAINGSFKDAMMALRELHQPADLEVGAPGKLKIYEIWRLPNVFQVRGGDFQAGQFDEVHIKDLRAALKATGGKLDPVVVWRCGGEWILIDGHHRAEAYRAEGIPEVPVEVFRGSPAEALEKAGEGNSRAKLPMTPSERGDFAWRITSAEPVGGWTWSKAKTASMTGCSPSLIGDMRRVKIEIQEAGEEPDKFPRWWMARKWQEERDPSDPEDEDLRTRLKADQYLDKLNRAVISPKQHELEAFALALMDFNGRHAASLVRLMGEGLGLRVISEDEDEDGIMFADVGEGEDEDF